MSSILDLAISISLADHISSGIKGIIGQFKLMENATKDAQAQMDKFKTMGFVGAGIGTAGALAFGGITSAIKETAKTAAEFEDVMNNVKMAAFGKDLIDPSKASEVKQTLNDLSAGFEKLGIATKFSDKGAAETALGMLRGGVDKDFLLGNKDANGNFNYSGLTAAMYSAQLGDIAPQEAGDFIAKQKAAFNMNGDRTLQTVDFYAKTAAASTMDMKSLIPGMLTASGVAGTLGMSPEDTALLVAATGTYTKDGGSAGTFTKDFLDRLIPHTKKQVETMSELGWLKNDGSSIFFDDSGKVKSADFIFQTMQQTSKKFRPDEFQSMMSRVFLEQGKNTALALSNQSGVYEDIKNNVGNQLDMYQQVKIQMQGTKNMSESLAETWNIVKRVFGDPFLDPIKVMLSGFNKVLGDSVIPWAKAHPEVIKVVTAIALGASAFLAIGGAITVGVAAFGALSAALVAAGTSLGAIALISGWIVVGIAAVAGAVYLIYKNWDKIGPFVKEIWEHVKQFTLSVWNVIGPTIMAAVGEIWNTIRTAFTTIVNFFHQIWPDVVSVVAIYWPIIKTYIVGSLNQIWINIKTFGNLIWITMKAAWTVISVEIQVAWTLIKDIVKFGWDFVSGLIKIGLKVLQGDWSGAWSALKETALNLWTDLKTLFNDGWEGIKKITSTWLTAAKQWGHDIVDGLIKGIHDSWDNLTKTINELSSSYLVGPLKKLLGINSPSRVMMEHGQYITQGLAIGMMNQSSLVKDASTELSKSVDVSAGISGSGIQVSVPRSAQSGGLVIQGPLIGEIHQQPGEDNEDLANRVMQKVMKLIDARSTRASLTIGTRGLQRGW